MKSGRAGRLRPRPFTYLMLHQSRVSTARALSVWISQDPRERRSASVWLCTTAFCNV
jgi:hypothetical protein